jgi:hypothetical protein
MFKFNVWVIGGIAAFLIITCMVATFGAGMIYQGHKDHIAVMQRPEPNNVYEFTYHLDLNKEYYILKDGDRIVDTIDVGKCPILDTIIMQDNE